MSTVSWESLFSLPPNQRQQHRMHLVGIGGTGLAPIAKVLLQLGYRVSGSDREENERTAALQKLGARTFVGHHAEQLLDNSTAPKRPDLVLISSAIPASNPEIVQARTWNIPVIKRKNILGPLTAQRDVIAVAGTHGKTTTTGMITHILTQAGKAPGYIIGSAIPGLGFSDAGQDATFVIEADEYDYMFLGLQPRQLIITNLDWDHPDMFPSPESYQDAFLQLLARLRKDGQAIICRNDRTLRSWQQEGRFPHSISYGSIQGADIRAEDIDLHAHGSSYRLVSKHESSQVTLSVPGIHNILNSLAALAATSAVDLPLAEAVPHLATFQGAARRFEIKGEHNGVLIIDDYAHHPTEIQSTLQAAQAGYPTRDIWAIYQPHTYSRTRTFLDLFNSAFNAADHLIVSDIYPAREPVDPTITPELVVAASHHEQAQAIHRLDDIATYLRQNLRPNSLVIILSAGTATRLAPMLLSDSTL